MNNPKKGDKYRDSRTGEIVTFRTNGDFAVSVDTDKGHSMIPHNVFNTFYKKV